MTQTNHEYAEALFMLGEETGNTASFLEAFEVLEQVLQENPAYLDVLISPALPLCERLGAIDEAFGTMPQDLVSFLKVLCAHGHMASLPENIREFKRLVKETSNRTAATVYTAHALTKEQEQALQKKLESVSGKAVDLTVKSDAALLGGLKIEMDGKFYDGSLKQRLHEVKEVMD